MVHNIDPVSIPVAASNLPEERRGVSPVSLPPSYGEAMRMSGSRSPDTRGPPPPYTGYNTEPSGFVPPPTSTVQYSESVRPADMLPLYTVLYPAVRITTPLSMAAGSLGE